MVAAGRQRGARARRWGRWGLVVAALVLVGLTVLPRVTSGRRLAAYIVARAQGKAGRLAGIDDVEWGWFKGAVLKGIRAEFGPGAEVQIGQVAVATSVWDVLVDRTVREVRLSDVAVDLQLGDKLQGTRDRREKPGTRGEGRGKGGQGDAETVRHGEGETKGQGDAETRAVGEAAPTTTDGGLPLAVRWFVLERCRVSLRDPEGGGVASVDLPTVTVELDRKTGVVKWQATVRVGPGGTVESKGQFVLPRLAVGPTDLRGSMEVAWKDLPLREVPASLLKRWGLTALDGTVSGALRAEMSQDWTLRYDVSGSAQSLVVLRAEGPPVRVSQAAGGSVGQWQMIDQRVRVQTAWARVPGAEVRAGEPGLVYDGQANRLTQSNLIVKVADARVLCEAIEGLGVAVPKDLELSGAAEVEVHVGREGSATAAQVTVSGEEVAGCFGKYFSRRAGEPLSVNISGRLWDDGSLDLTGASVDLPGGRIRAGGHLAAREGTTGRAVDLQDGIVRVEWQEFEKFAGQVPVLAELLGPIVSVKGPGNVQVQVATGREGARASLAVELPAGAGVSVDGWFEKPVGRDLHLDVATRVGERFDWVAVDRVAVRTATMGLREGNGPAASGTPDRDMMQSQASAPSAVDDSEVDGVVALLRDLEVRVRRVVEEGRPVLGVSIQGALAGVDVRGVRELSPRLAEVLGRVGAEGRLSGKTNVSCWADASGRSLRVKRVQGSGELGLDELGLSVEGVLQKRVGDRLRLAGSVGYEWAVAGKRRSGFGCGSIESAGFTGQVWYEDSPGSAGAQQWAWGWADVRDIQQAVAMVPAMVECVRRDCIGGRATGRWEWTRHDDTFDLDLGIDLTGLECRQAQAGIRKRAGLPARAEVTVSGPAGSAAGSTAKLWRLPKATLVLGQSRAEILNAQVEMTEPWARLLGGRADKSVRLMDYAWPVRHGSGKVAGTIAFGEMPESVSRDVGTLFEKWQVSGPVPWTVDWEYDAAKGIEFAGKADAAGLALRTDAVEKGVGVPLAASVKGGARLAQNSQRQLMLSLHVAEAKGAVADLTWSGQGQVELRLVGGRWEPANIQVGGKFDSKAVEEVAGLIEPIRPLQLRGHVAAEGKAEFTEQAGWKIEDLDLGVWPVECVVEGMPCRLMGLVNVQDHTAQATGLEAWFGRTYGRVTFDTTLADNGLRGQVGTAFSCLDVEELVGFGKRIAASRERRAASDNDRIVKQNGPETRSENRIDWGRSDLKFVGSAGQVMAPIVEGRPAVRMNALSWWGSLDRGALAVDFAGAFEGGPLSADVRGNLVDKNVPLRIHYRADRSNVTELTRYMVVKGFPGMTVDGAVSLDETLTIDMARQQQAVPSAGELIVDGGIVRGAAAPKWVMRVFPGLQLASFKFSRMHDWYERDASGKTIHRIIFRGSPWSMYMNGWSMQDGTMRYEIGVDLLGAAESEYWATADRGRMPLFIKTGRVVDGKVRNEVVSFLGPQQIGARILKDNLLTITYHAVRQQVLRGRGGPSDKEVLAPGVTADDKVTK